VPGESHDRWIDRVIDNRYRITEPIGRGGMGSVYKVVHTQIGKVAALKLLHGNLAGDKELIKRFHREAESISRLNHPNIVQVFDFGRVDETVYLVMEYLRGEDLSAILHRDGPIHFLRCTPILIQICDALTEAHESGIVHRDLKPENVRVARTRDGQDYVKVMDFGLAKMLMEEDQDPAITARGNLVGTPYYMAPELIRAQPLDGRADIYSLGAMAYRMLTGENAFMANTPVGVLTKHITDELTPPSARAPNCKIPDAVNAMVVKAMAKDPALRYRSAAELKRDLVELMGHSPPGQISGSFAWRTTSSVPIGRESDPFTESQRAELGELPTGRIDEDAITVDPVLSKEDLAFERRLRLSTVLKPLLVVLLLGLAGFAVYWFGLRQGALYAPPEELEPNNTADRATLLDNGKPVTGKLGKRLSPTESDRDWYLLKVGGSGPQTLRGTLSGIPNMDVTLELYDGSTNPGKITGADSTGEGGGEVITNWTLEPGRYYLLVREVWATDVAPTENVTDPYSLFVRWQPHERGSEMEPNDGRGQGTPVAPGQLVRGYLGGVDDVDRYRVNVDRQGKLTGKVTGVKGVDLVLEVWTDATSRPVVIDRAGESGGERFSVAVNAGQSPVILLRRKEQKKALLTRNAPGIDIPYSLSVELK